MTEKFSESRTPNTAPSPISPAFFQLFIIDFLCRGGAKYTREPRNAERDRDPRANALGPKPASKFNALRARLGRIDAEDLSERLLSSDPTGNGADTTGLPQGGRIHQGPWTDAATQSDERRLNATNLVLKWRPAP